MFLTVQRHKPGQCFTKRQMLLHIAWLSGIFLLLLLWVAHTWYVVSEANRGEGDHHEVQRLQKRPLLHPLEHECRHSEEDQATQQDGENCWNHPHGGRPHFAFLRER